jgi:outer membrane beta-barrel protein
MARKHAGLEALLVALSLTLAPVVATAQPEDDEGEAGDDEGDEPTGDEDDEDDATEGTGAGGLKELCEIDPDSCPQIDWDEYAAREVRAEMYAVQQIWALRANRAEINIYGAFTMNDQFVAHPGIGLGINYYIINPLAIGVNGNFYHGLNSQSDFNFETSRAARIGQPITEYSWNANVNLTYVPAYGKFAAFQDFIFHYDFYLLVGGGVISTRPIAVVDPDNRTFDYTIRPTWGFGGGIRIFFTRWLSAMLEVRDYMFLEDLENPSIATGFDSNGNPRAQNQDTWLAPDQSFTNNVQAQLGLSFFLPPTWEYQLPK